MPGQQNFAGALLCGEPDDDAGQRGNRIYGGRVPITRKNAATLRDTLKPKPVTGRILSFLKAMNTLKAKPYMKLSRIKPAKHTNPENLEGGSL